MVGYKYKELSEEEKTTTDAEHVKEVDDQNESSEILAQIVLVYEKNKLACSKNELPFLPLKGVLYLMAANAGIPFFIPATKFAGNDAVLGGVFGTSIYVAIGSISVWSVRNLLNYIALVLTTSRESRCSEVILTMSSLALGVFSAVPGVLVSLRYNPAWMIIFSSFFDITTNTVSFNQLLRQLYIDKYSYRNTKEVRNKRDQFIANLHSGVSDSEPISSNITQKMVLDELRMAVEVAKPTLQIHARHPMVYKYGREGSKQMIGILLPISWGVVSIYLVYSDMRKKLHYNMICSALTAVLATGPSYYLEYLFCKSLTDSLYRFIANWAFGVRGNASILNYYPIPTIGMLLFFTGLISFSFAGRAQVVSDLFVEGELLEFMLIAVSFGTVVFKLSAAVANTFDCGTILSSALSTHPVFARKLLLSTAEVVLTAAKPNATNQLLRLVYPEPVPASENVTQYPLEIESGVFAEPSNVVLCSLFKPNKKRASIVVEQGVGTENEEVLSENVRTSLLHSSFCCIS